jgi:hypothetical protein
LKADWLILTKELVYQTIQDIVNHKGIVFLRKGIPF